MTSGETVVTAREKPVFFPSGKDLLFGILTEPAAAARGVAVVTLSGGVHVTSANRNRVWVQLARRLATAGFHTLRFDYRGVGESGGKTEAYDRENPRSEDLLAGIAWLRAQGFERFVLVGTCFGSLTAFTAAPRVEGLDALVLLSPLILESKSSAELAARRGILAYVARLLRPRVVRGFFRPATRAAYLRMARAKTEMMRTRSSNGSAAVSSGVLPASSRLLRTLEFLVRAEIPVFVVFGSRDVHYEDWRRAMQGRLGEMVNRAPRLETRLIEGFLHSFPQLSVQDEVVEAVDGWISATVI